eukprot:8185355-Lingulodinium_polyedra.AAC.1
MALAWRSRDSKAACSAAGAPALTMAGAKCSNARESWSSTAVCGTSWPPCGCPEEQEASGPGGGPPWAAWCSAE